MGSWVFLLEFSVQVYFGIFPMEWVRDLFGAGVLVFGDPFWVSTSPLGLGEVLWQIYAVPFGASSALFLPFPPSAYPVVLFPVLV